MGCTGKADQNYFTTKSQSHAFGNEYKIINPIYGALVKKYSIGSWLINDFDHVQWRDSTFSKNEEGIWMNLHSESNDINRVYEKKFLPDSHIVNITFKEFRKASWVL